MDAGELQKFIYERVVKNPKFRAVIYVSVDRYPGESFATIWVGQEPDAEMRQYTSQLEEDLASLGAPCTVLVKSEKELLSGNTYKLRTSKGEFSYRSCRIDAATPERFGETYRGACGPAPQVHGR